MVSQVVQTLGLGSCHLVQASLQIWLFTLVGCYLVEVGHCLENFCLTLVEAHCMVCVKSGLDQKWQLWNGHFHLLGHYGPSPALDAHVSKIGILGMAIQCIQTQAVVAQSGKRCSHTKWLCRMLRCGYHPQSGIFLGHLLAPKHLGWQRQALRCVGLAGLWPSHLGPFRRPICTMELPLLWQSCQLTIKPPRLLGWHKNALGGSWLVQAKPFSKRMARHGSWPISC